MSGIKNNGHELYEGIIVEFEGYNVWNNFHAKDINNLHEVGNIEGMNKFLMWRMGFLFHDKKTCHVQQ
jgi:hypothetical protein